jgi:phospholipid/cholesterol/gamma-HCH transport system permease protein
MRTLGRFAIFMYRMITNREPFRVYWKLYFEECMIIGIDSIKLVAITSTFMGAVTAVQTAYNLYGPFVPLYLVGFMVRDMTILELSPTVLAFVFAGKIGSNIAGQLGTMKITEQVDALEVMGINSISFLVLPKVLACVSMYPMLVALSGFLSITGGYYAGTLADLYTPADYIYGVRLNFQPFNILFALTKAFVFSFLIASISAYKGYHTEGGALEVGVASTKAVTNSCIAILAADYLLARMLV